MRKWRQSTRQAMHPGGQSRSLANWTNCSQLGPALKMTRAGAIYSRLFKYTQKHTAGFTENSNFTPHLLSPVVGGINRRVYGKYGGGYTHY